MVFIYYGALLSNINLSNKYKCLPKFCNMASKLPKSALNLKQEVLKLYREIFRTLRKIPDASTRQELKEWAKTDFKSNKHYSDETSIKSMLHYGKKSLKDLQRSLALSES